MLTHGHPDHIGGVNQICAHFGRVPVYKMPWPTETGLSGPGGEASPTPLENPDALSEAPLEALADGDVVETEGARLRAIFTPGHSPDHLCYVLEEEGNLFSGDNVLGVGTTVIPAESGDLGDYMRSLDRALEEAPNQIYPAHGPRIEDGVAKIREYRDHRLEREAKVLAAVRANPGLTIRELVPHVYQDVAQHLYRLAERSLLAHVLKLEADGAALCNDGHWTLSD